MYIFRLIPGPLVYRIPFRHPSPLQAQRLHLMLLMPGLSRPPSVSLHLVWWPKCGWKQGICWGKWLLLYWLWEGTPWIFMFIINHSSQMMGFKTTRFDLGNWSYWPWVVQSLPEHGPCMTSDFSPCSLFQEHRLQTWSISRDVHRRSPRFIKLLACRQWTTDN